MPPEIKLTKAEAEVVLRALWGDCAEAGKTCPRDCGNLEKPCIKLRDQAERKLLKVLKGDEHGY